MRIRTSGLLAAALSALSPSAALAQPLPTTALGTFAGVSSSAFVDDWESFIRFKGEIYFAADGGDGAGTELWRTDGTPGGTVRVTDLNPGAGHALPQGFAVFGRHLYFTANPGGGARLYRTDAVDGVVEFAPYGVAGLRATSIGLFGTFGPAGQGTEPWFSNGTTHGLLRNIGPASQNGTPLPAGGLFTFEDRGGTVFFGANDRTSTSGQLWKTLGTEASTEKVLTLSVGAGFPAGCTSQVPGPPGEFFAYGGTLHFAATWYDKTSPAGSCFTSGQDRGYLGALWTSTGSAGLPLATRALASALGAPAARVWVDRASPRWRRVSATGPLGGVHLVEGRDELVSGDITYGGPPRLYAFDGVGFTPLLAGEFVSGTSAFERIGRVGARLVFVRNRTGAAGFGSVESDVMATDGTPGGTSLLATYSGTTGTRVAAGDAGDGLAYFAANGADGLQLYRTDGTGAPEKVSAFASATELGLLVGAALPGGVAVLTHDGNLTGTLRFVGTPGLRVVRQPLSAPGVAAHTLSDATGTLGVAFDVQSIAGSGELRLELLDHATTPLAGGAPSVGVLRSYVRIERPSSIATIETDLTLTYTDAALVEAGIADETALVVWKHSDGVWTRLVPAMRNAEANTLTVTGLTSFSDFVIADGAASLPVELVAFTAVADGATARLAWTTASETNNAGFGVEHLQGAAWIERGFVAGRGTTTERTAYAFNVEGLTAGRHTFRLRQVDLDGTAGYSPTVTVEVRVGTGADGTGRPGLRLTALGTHGVRVEADAEAAVEVVDLLGRRVLARRVEPGTTDVRLDGVAAGMYVVRVHTGQDSETRRMVVR